jgi:high-affinity iron transporter
LLAFVAVVREGLETVLLLLSAKTEGSHATGTSVVVGGLIGLAIAAVLGWITYLGGARINMRIFFNITGVPLILFAAGLFAQVFHEICDIAGATSGWLATPAWNVTSGPFAHGNVNDFVSGFFGWSADPERIRVIAYFAYLVPVLAIYLRHSSVSAGRPATSAPGHRAVAPSAH